MKTLGIYISTIRPELWERLISNFVTNVDYEIVFVGPLKDVSVPPNCRFIYSEASPVECSHIGAMACNSKYIMNLPDDTLFEKNFALDSLIEEKKMRSESSIVSPFYFEDPNIQRLLVKKEVNSWNPLMPVGSLMTKDLYVSLGGADKRFQRSLGDLDIAMRAYEKGGKVFINKSVRISETIAELYKKSSSDMDLLLKLWTSSKWKWFPTKKGKKKKQVFTIHKKRKDAVQSFEL